MASIWVPFFVHRKVPRSESIDFSQEGSFSTIHLGILLSLCTVLDSVFNQIYWLCLIVKASVFKFCTKADRYLFADVAINRKEQQTTLSYTYIIPAMYQKETMRRRDVRKKTHAYSALRSESKKYAKAERRRRRKPR